MLARLLTAVLLATACTSAPAAEGLLLARLDAGTPRLIELQTSGTQSELSFDEQLRTSLGSVWKLFVHAYLLDQQISDSGYQCSGNNREEVYCCEPGEKIDRNTALVRSCGLYYTPARLGIDAAAWRMYWMQRQAPPWLLDLSSLQPATEVPVLELLQVLQQLPKQTELRASLLDVVLQADKSDVVAALGSRLRIKTWSWHRADDSATRIGGFAGWLSDGSPVWASASGTSQSVLRRYASALDSALPTPVAITDSDCVRVNMFARYPIVAVRTHGQPVAAGPLFGQQEVHFAAGNAFDIVSSGELSLTGQGESWTITAQLSREDYVARVLDREASAEPVQAARALAIVIRTYLQQSALSTDGCLHIDDSSATQRVAARPASAAAKKVAAWTADLVLAGPPVQYHLQKGGPDRLSWADAVIAANAGQTYTQILAPAFARSNLARWGETQATCQPLLAAEAWLLERLPRWRARLNAEIGYAETPELTVCQLQHGRPHVMREQRRIFIRGLRSEQDRLDLLHEYLHLAFAAHPSGQDEHYVESLARRLLLESH
ncbi:MAG: DUF2300 domain-containing protein [Pseudomarimonas sp.]